MKTNQTISALSALAHEGRLALFRLLVQAGPSGMAAGDLVKATGAAFTTTSAQLSVLANAGLIASRREGRSIIYAADYDAINGVFAYLLSDCCAGRPEIIKNLAAIAADPSEREIQ